MSESVELGNPILNKRADKLTGYLTSESEFSALLGPPSERLSWLQHATPAGYRRLVTAVNALARDKNPLYHELDAGDVRVGNGGAIAMLPPDSRDKSTLLNLSVETARRITTKDTLSDPERLRIAALELSGVINLVHPALDRNGTTGRIIGYLLDQGFLQPKRQVDELAKIMSDQGRRYVRTGTNHNYGQVALGVVRREIDDMGVDFRDTSLPRQINWTVLGSWTPTDFDAALHSTKDRQRASDLLNNETGAFIITFRFALENGYLSQPGVLVQSSASQSPIPELDALAVMKAAENEGKLDQFFESHRKFRSDVVKLFMDEMENPVIISSGFRGQRAETVRARALFTYQGSDLFADRAAERSGRNLLASPCVNL